MEPGANTPEELETLLEDACVMRDPDAVRQLFENGALFVAGAGVREARGTDQIAEAAPALWKGGRSYVADPRQIVQSRDTALMVGERAINVGRRGADGAWRFVISLLFSDDARQEEQMSRQTTQTLQPVVVHANQGEARWWFQGLAIIRATSADTGGRMALVEMTEPPGTEAPLHVHHREDEAFFILEGSARLQIGDETIDVRAGDYAFGPRDIPHRYIVGDEGCRMLFICTPGGFEHLVREMSEPAGSRTLPPPSDVEPDMQRIAAVAEAHGCELLA